nr:uncharacterized protein LOC112749751 isoform X4 [Arachis hypogaea]
MSVRGGEAATIIVACGVTAVRSRCRRCWRWVAKPLPLENTAAIAKEHCRASGRYRSCCRVSLGLQLVRSTVTISRRCCEPLLSLLILFGNQ